MKPFLSYLLISITILSCNENPPPVPVIFDTDIAPDYDDVGALAMLHAFADHGEVEILATISSNAFETTAPVLSVINTYFNRENIPVGILKANQPNFSCQRLWAEKIIAGYPHSVKTNEDGKDTIVEGNRISYLLMKQKPEEISLIIEDLMMHQPKSKK